MQNCTANGRGRSRELAEGNRAVLFAWRMGMVDRRGCHAQRPAEARGKPFIDAPEKDVVRICLCFVWGLRFLPAGHGRAGVCSCHAPGLAEYLEEGILLQRKRCSSARPYPLADSRRARHAVGRNDTREDSEAPWGVRMPVLGLCMLGDLMASVVVSVGEDTIRSDAGEDGGRRLLNVAVSHIRGTHGFVSSPSGAIQQTPQNVKTRGSGHRAWCSFSVACCPWKEETDTASWPDAFFCPLGSTFRGQP
jgi:hypothetical protein